jgi:hypothetical protein
VNVSPTPVTVEAPKVTVPVTVQPAKVEVRRERRVTTIERDENGDITRTVTE